MRCPLCTNQLQFAVSLVGRRFIICTKKKPYGQCTYMIELDKLPGLESAMARAVQQVIDEFEPEGGSG